MRVRRGVQCGEAYTRHGGGGGAPQPPPSLWTSGGAKENTMPAPNVNVQVWWGRGLCVCGERIAGPPSQGPRVCSRPGGSGGREAGSSRGPCPGPTPGQRPPWGPHSRLACGPAYGHGKGDTQRTRSAPTGLKHYKGSGSDRYTTNQTQHNELTSPPLIHHAHSSKSTAGNSNGHAAHVDADGKAYPRPQLPATVKVQHHAH
jgi:hypothetical protein